MLFLSLNLSGALPVMSALVRDASADVPSFNVHATETQAGQIEDQLRLMVRRARHPGTPGTPEGVPTQADIAQIESVLGDWKTGIERILALPNAPASPGSAQGDYLPTDAKLRIVNLYFNQLTLLTTLRIALDLEHGREWTDRFALHIPKAIMDAFPGLGAPARNRAGDRFLPLVIDRGDDGQADPVQLRLSEMLVQGLEVGRLSDDPSSSNFLTMIQYLAVRQLLQNLADLRYLKQDHDIEMPEIPSPLRDKLETMGLISAIDGEQRRAVAEPGARAALSDQLGAISSQLPAFVTEELANQIVSTIARTRSQRRQVEAPLKAALQEAEHDNLPAAVSQEIAASSLPLSSMQSVEMLPTLRYFLANAKANTLLDKFLHMMADGVLDLRPEQRAQIMGYLEARKAAYAALIPDSALQAWFSASRRASEQALYEDRRSQFVEDLMFHAPEVAKQVQQSYAGETIDPSVLSRSFARDLARMNPRESVKDWLYEVSHESTYAAARDQYARKMQSLTSPHVLVNGIIDPARVQLFVDTHDFRPDIQFSPDVNPILAQRLIDRVTQGRKNDITHFLQIGDWMGFNRLFTQASPTVADIITDEGQRGKYFDVLDDTVLSRYPILATEVSVTTADGGNTSDRLYDALAAVNPYHQSSPEILANAQLLVDQALIQTESKIRQDIQTVAEAHDLHDIERVVQSSMMLTLVMSSFPEFRVSQDHFIEDLLEPSLTAQIMHRYVGNAMTWGCAALMLLHFGPKIFKKAAPFADAITEVMGPMIEGASRAMMILMLADTAYQAHELYEMREGRQQTEDFFFSSASGHSFFEYGELEAANSSYQFSKWMFIGMQALNYLPMGYGALKGVITARGTRIAFEEFMGDVEAKRLLGIEPADWDQGHLDQAIARVRAEAGSMNADDLAATERAYVRLSDKVRAGETWDLASIMSGDSPTPTELRVRRALQGAGLLPRTGTGTGSGHGGSAGNAAPPATGGAS